MLIENDFMHKQNDVTSNHRRKLKKATTQQILKEKERKSESEHEIHITVIRSFCVDKDR